MAKTKLTLWIDEIIIKEAKHYAIEQNKSLSEIIENLIKTLFT